MYLIAISGFFHHIPFEFAQGMMHYLCMFFQALPKIKPSQGGENGAQIIGKHGLSMMLGI